MHGLQSNCLVAPGSFLKVPAGHAVGWTLAASQKCPGGHWTQAADVTLPVVGLYVPGAHLCSSKAAVPSGQKCPGTHGSGRSLPPWQKKPGGQLEHSLADVRLRAVDQVPAGHGKEVDDGVPSGQKKPGEHASGGVTSTPVPQPQANPEGHASHSLMRVRCNERVCVPGGHGYWVLVSVPFGQ